MKILSIVFGLSAALIMGLLLVASPASAQDSREEITLSPATTKVSAEPGQELAGSFKVINTGQANFRFTVYARPYSVETEAYNPNYSAISERSSVYRWVQFDTTEGELAPGAEQEIGYTIRIPEEASPGGHYSVLFAETVPESTDNQMVIHNKRVGTVVRLTVDGERQEAGQTTRIDLPRLQLQAPLQASVRVENTGNVDLDVETTLVVRSLFGRELHSQASTNAVFPDQPRVIERQWAESPVFGLYRVDVSSRVLGEDIVASKYVLIIPAGALGSIAIIVLAGALYAGYRRLRR